MTHTAVVVGTHLTPRLPDPTGIAITLPKMIPRTWKQARKTRLTIHYNLHLKSASKLNYWRSYGDFCLWVFGLEAKRECSLKDSESCKIFNFRKQTLKMGENDSPGTGLQYAVKNRPQTIFFRIRGSCIIYNHPLFTVCSHSRFVQVCNLLVLRITSDTKTHAFDEFDSNLGLHFQFLSCSSVRIWEKCL